MLLGLLEIRGSPPLAHRATPQRSLGLSALYLRPPRGVRARGGAAAAGSSCTCPLSYLKASTESQEIGAGFPAGPSGDPAKLWLSPGPRPHIHQEGAPFAWWPWGAVGGRGPGRGPFCYCESRRSPGNTGRGPCFHLFHNNGTAWSLPGVGGTPLPRRRGRRTRRTRPMCLWGG